MPSTQKQEPGSTRNHRDSWRVAAHTRVVRAKRLTLEGRPRVISSALVLALLCVALGVEAKPAPRVTARWVLEKPPSSTQVQKTVEQRGGENPCNTADPGFGAYRPWERTPSMGQMIVPRRLKKGARFDVMFHFHGHEAARKEWVKVMDGPVLVGIDLGLGSGPYEESFASPATFEKLVESVEDAMAEHLGVKQARARFIGLSAWSAEYGAVGRILSQPLGQRRVDTVILLDGLHSGYAHDGGTLNELQLAPFGEFAARAARGRRLMFVTHSSIIPPGYASTTETANYLVAWVGGHPRPSRPRPSDPVGMDLISWFVQGSFHVRGYAGNDKMDHCAQLTLYQDILRVHVRRRWGV